MTEDGARGSITGHSSPKAGVAGDYVPADVSASRRLRRRFVLRSWAVEHARLLEWIYGHFAHWFLRLHPFWKAVGYANAEAPVKFVEKRLKGFMFDCRMCGDCILSSTGMSCPMNCPKQLRNGPCGGVRANGNCEIEPAMPCVWVQAWIGSRQMKAGDSILAVQRPLDQSHRETSSWLRVTAQAAAAGKASHDPETP